MAEIQVYEFGSYRLDAAEKQLFKEGALISLTPKALDILVVLVKKHGHLVNKDELIKEVWPNTFVSDGSLTHHIHQIRKALNGDIEGLAYIETVPRRGYRFKAEISRTFLDSSMTESPRTVTAESGGTLARDSTPSTPTPAERWPARSVGKAKYVLYFCVAVAVVFASYIWLSHKSKSAEPIVHPNSVAILPFKSIGNSHDALGLGMADALIMKLSSLNQLKVLPISAVTRFEEGNQDPSAIGRELGVDAIIGGTVQEADGRARVSVQVTNVNTGQTIWQANFDEKFTDVFTVQESISERIAETFALELNGDNRKQLAKRSTNDPEAYRLYSLGLYFWSKRTSDSLNKAIGSFQRAVDKDPHYATAYAVMADAYQMQTFYGQLDKQHRDESIQAAKTAAERALTLDPTVPEAYVALAAVKSYELDDAGAEDCYKRAISLAPNYATAHIRYGRFLSYNHSRIEDGLQQIKIGRDLDPLSALNNALLANLLIYVRQYDDAIKYSRRAMEIDPNIVNGRLSLGMGYVGKRMYREAIAELTQIGGEDPQRILALQELAYAYAASGEAGSAKEILNQLEQLASAKRLRPVNDVQINMAGIYMALGERDRAFQWLDRIQDIKELENQTATQLQFDPQLDLLRRDPRFDQILRRHSLTNHS